MIDASNNLRPDDRHRHRRRDEVFVPIAGGVVVAVTGSLVGSALGWGASAFWGVASLAGAVATLLMARGTRMHALRRGSDSLGLPAAMRDRRTRRERPAQDTRFAVGVNLSARERGVGGLHPRKVIALAGPSASRKSSIAKYSAGHHGGWAWAGCGSYVKAMARARGIPEDDLVATHELGQHLVDQMGGRRFLDAVIAHAHLDDAGIDTLVVDDIYHREVFDALKERWSDLHFVAIDLPVEMRRRVMEDRGVPPDKVDDLEDSKLEHAAVELMRVHGNDLVHLQGAVTEDEVPERSQELFELVAA